MAKDKQNNLFIILIACAAILLSIFIVFYDSDGSSNDRMTQTVQNEFPPMQEDNSIESIEEDLNATELEDIDMELDQIESELEAAY